MFCTGLFTLFFCCSCCCCCCLVSEGYHCVKSVSFRSFSDLYFPAFGLNTERYSVSLCIQSECRKIRARKLPNMDTFHVVYDSYFPRRTWRVKQENTVYYCQHKSNLKHKQIFYGQIDSVFTFLDSEKIVLFWL